MLELIQLLFYIIINPKITTINDLAMLLQFNISIIIDVLYYTYKLKEYTNLLLILINF